MIRYLVGTQKEADIFMKVYSECPKGSIEVVGVRGEYLGNTEEDDILVDIGYAAGYRVPVGAIVEPTCAMDVEKHEAIRIDTIFPVERRVCFSGYTKEHFGKYRAIFDGRLFKVAHKPHKRIYSIKIVSQDMDGYWDGDVHEGAWKVIAGYLGEYLKEGK